MVTKDGEKEKQDAEIHGVELSSLTFGMKRGKRS
jgi:hypothetical protein